MYKWDANFWKLNGVAECDVKKIMRQQNYFHELSIFPESDPLYQFSWITHDNLPDTA